MIDEKYFIDAAKNILDFYLSIPEVYEISCLNGFDYNIISFDFLFCDGEKTHQINKDYRNKGVGKALLQNAVDYAKNNDCEVIELTSYIDNENAHRFYENNNFIKHSYKFKQYLK